MRSEVPWNMDVEVLKTITKTFVEDLLADRLEDWSTAVVLGESFVEGGPTCLIGHLILCRGLRHLGAAPLCPVP